MANHESASRMIETLTGSWERRVLPRMAGALPQWVTPDHLTLLGLIAALLIGIAYALTWFSNLWLLAASLGLIVHWFADSLDGTLARVRGIERENYGYFVDHICDAITVLMLCVGFGFSPLMNMSVALFLAITYYLLNIYAHIAAYTEHIFRLSYYKIGPTEVRILIILLNTIIMFWNPVAIEVYSTMLTALDLAGIVLSLIFFFAFLSVTLKDARKLDAADRAQWR